MDERFELWAIEDGLEFWRCPEGLLTSINEQRDALLAACEAAYHKLVVAHAHDGGYCEHPDNPLPRQLRTALALCQEQQP